MDFDWYDIVWSIKLNNSHKSNGGITSGKTFQFCRLLCDKKGGQNNEWRNENVTVNGAGTQDEEPAAKNNETKAEKFIRLGEYRMNKAIDAIGRLEHLVNRSAYEYTAEQVEAMFGALENKVADVKAKFNTKKQDNTSFSFGTHAE